MIDNQTRQELVTALEAVQAGIMMLLYPNSPVAQDHFKSTGRHALFEASDVNTLITAITIVRNVGKR